MRNLKRLLALFLTIVLAVSCFTITAFAAEETEYNKIYMGAENIVTVYADNEAVIYEFCPEKSGLYTFYTLCEYDTAAELYDKDGNYIDESDDYKDDLDFYLVAELNAGEKYLLSIWIYNSINEATSFNVYVDETKAPTYLQTSAKESYVMNVGDYIEVDVEVGPDDSYNTYYVESYSEDEDTTENIIYCYSYDDLVEIHANFPGEAYVRVYTINGLEELIKIQVIKPEPVEIDFCEEYTLTKNDENCCVFTFKPNFDKPTDCVIAYINSKNAVAMHLTDNNDADFYQYYGISSGSVVATLNPDGEYELMVIGGNEGDLIAVAPMQDVERVKIVDRDYVSYCYSEILMEANVYPFYAYYDSVEWTSSDENIASVTSDGWIYFLAEGTVDITVSVGGKSDTVTVESKGYSEISGPLEKSYNLPSGGIVYYKFVPEVSGRYNLYTTGTSDTIITVYDQWETWEIEDDESGEDNNASLTHYFEAGVPYYLEVRECYGNAAKFTFCLEAAPSITSIEILKLPDEENVYPEYAYDLEFWGLKLRFNFSDGSYEDVVYDVTDTDINYDVDVTFVYDDKVQATVSADGVSVDFFVPIVENPVSKIELNEDFKIIVYEETCGYLHSDEFDEEYYEYSYSIPNDLEFIVHYTDGTSEIFEYAEFFYMDHFNTEDNQNDEHWMYGKDNFVTVKYCGAECLIPVEVRKNNLVDAKVTKLPNKTKYIFGDGKYGRVNEDGEYCFVPDYTGMEITVYDDDGGELVFQYDNERDRVLLFELFGIGDNTYDVFAVGDCNISFEIYEIYTEFTVEIVDSGISSIEIIKDPTITDHYCYGVPDIRGMQVKLIYADGSEEIITVSDENLVMYDDPGYLSATEFYIECGEEDLYLREDTGDTFLTTGNQSVLIDSLNFIAEDATEVDVIQYSFDTQNAKLKMSLEDGSTYTLNAEYTGISDLYYTELGILELSFDVEENDGVIEGILSAFYMQFPVYIESTSDGDCNGDGSVNTTDLAVLKLFLAGEGDITSAGDINGDGEINTTDLAELKLLLAGVN